MTSTTTKPNTAIKDTQSTITVLGFGSLLSERSSRLTFPNLVNFRLGRVPNHRRVFAHPAPIFFERGIANMDTQEISSLSAEFVGDDVEDDVKNCSFICSVFEVPSDGLIEIQNPSDGTSPSVIIPSQAFLEREEEFDIQQVPYLELNDTNKDSSSSELKLGILCRRSTDEKYIQQWGKDRFQQKFKSWGLNTIWGYEKDSGIRPCATYLRHCVLAAKGMGKVCYDSFLDETFLVDRTTTIRTYLKQHPYIMTTLPPPELAERYCG